MKIFKRLILGLLAVVVLLVVALYATGYGYILRGVRVTYLNGHSTAFLDDYKYFNNDTLFKSNTPQPWPVSKNYNSVKATPRLEDWHKDIGSVAFLIIKNDSLWYEWYGDGYGKTSHSNSFSMAKSIVTAALGKAISEGKISSLNAKVGQYFPEFSKDKAARLTVGDLASMASGLDWDEKYYSPFSKTTQLYFDQDLSAFMRGIPVITEPGKTYAYSSGATQLLAMTVEKAVGQKLTQYVDDKFWKPMGAETDAYWQTDGEGLVKAYCCIASNARDFARFGKLYKQHGKWNGTPILDSAFVAQSITPRFQDSPQYGYGWWLAEFEGKKVFYMRGHLGQYVIVVPQDELIIVRLGHKGNQNAEGQVHSKDFWVYLEESYRMLGLKK